MADQVGPTVAIGLVIGPAGEHGEPLALVARPIAGMGIAKALALRGSRFIHLEIDVRSEFGQILPSARFVAHLRQKVHDAQGRRDVLADHGPDKGLRGLTDDRGDRLLRAIG